MRPVSECSGKEVLVIEGETGFHTQKGYEKASENQLTAAMEDYLEMICRLSGDSGYTRVGPLSRNLHVKPSSASKMVDHLKETGFVRAEKYGCITLTEEGWEKGRYLLYRHGLLNEFLCKINGTAQELEQVERIEHFIDERTVRNIARFLAGAPPDESLPVAGEPIALSPPKVV